MIKFTEEELQDFKDGKRKLTDEEIVANWQVMSNVILVRLYIPTEEAENVFVRKDGTKSQILAPEEYLKKREMTESFHGFMGKILAIGRDAFTEPRIFPKGARFKVGDVVKFNRHDYFPIYLVDGTRVAEIYDNKPTSIIHNIDIISTENFTL